VYDPFEEERRLREEEERQLREEEEELRRQEEELKRQVELERMQIEAEMRYAREEEERMRLEERRAKENAKDSARYEAELMQREMEALELRKRIEEERARKQAEEQARNANNTTTAPSPPSTTTALSPEERQKAIEERQRRDQQRWKEEVNEEQRRNQEREERLRKENPTYDPWGSNYSNADYTPQTTPSFNPNETYSVPKYYKPHGVKLYPIYPANYFATVHPFAFVAADGRDPNSQDAIRNKTEEIQRIIEQNKKNSAGDQEEQRYLERMRYQNEEEQKRIAALRKTIDETPKKPLPVKEDDGIDPNTLPKPTVHMIPPRKWDDSTETYEAPKYIIPSNPNGVIVMHRREGSVCQTKELLNSPTRSDILSMFDLSNGKLTNVQTGAEITNNTPLPSGCYKLERKIDMQFYRSFGAMPLYASGYSGFSNSFHSQFERVPSALVHQRTTSFVDDIVFSYGNVRTSTTLRTNSYNESSKPPTAPGNSYYNPSGDPYSAPPGWFKSHREKHTKTDYVVCIRNVFRKAGKEPPLRLHRALKDSLDNNKCVVCKQFATDMLCDTHKDERFTALVQAVGGNFGEIFGVSTETLSVEEEVESPIYYKNHGEVVMPTDGDSTKLQYIDFSDPNVQPKHNLDGLLAERFNRIKENARMTYEMMMNDDYLVHKPGSEQAHLYD
jgi:hypothetical protein